MAVKAYDGYRGLKPTVDEIVFKPYTDMTTAYTDVQAGNTDILFVPVSRMAQVKKDSGWRDRPGSPGHHNAPPGVSCRGAGPSRRDCDGLAVRAQLEIVGRPSILGSVPEEV